jgi:hypothetical protein
MLKTLQTNLSLKCRVAQNDENFVCGFIQALPMHSAIKQPAQSSIRTHFRTDDEAGNTVLLVRYNLLRHSPPRLLNYGSVFNHANVRRHGGSINRTCGNAHDTGVQYFWQNSSKREKWEFIGVE